MALTSYSNFGADAKALIASGSKGVVRVLGGNGVNSTMYFLQLHDATSEPSTGSVPKVSIPVGIGVPTSLTENERNWTKPDYLPFAAGIYACWSSTDGTYTPVTPASQRIEIDYV